MDASLDTFRDATPSTAASPARLAAVPDDVTHVDVPARERSSVSDLETPVATVEVPMRPAYDPMTFTGIGAHPSLTRPGLAHPVPPVRRKRGRPRDPLADGRILAAASSLILVRGFDAMTVDEVATTAGVGKATVYRRWARKEDLAVAAMQQLYSDEMPVPDTGSLRGDLAEAYRLQLGFARSAAGADYLRTLVKESMRDERMAALYRSAHEQSERNAHAIFRRAKERGEIDVDVPVDLLIKLLSGLVVLATVMGTPTPTPDEVDSLVDLVVRGISA